MANVSSNLKNKCITIVQCRGTTILQDSIINSLTLVTPIYKYAFL